MAKSKYRKLAFIKHTIAIHFVSEEQPKYDDERDRLMRFVRFGGFFIILMVIWYSAGLAEFV